MEEGKGADWEAANKTVVCHWRGREEGEGEGEGKVGVAVADSAWFCDPGSRVQGSVRG